MEEEKTRVKERRKNEIKGNRQRNMERRKGKDRIEKVR